jgi:hypothetical protein
VRRLLFARVLAVSTAIFALSASPSLCTEAHAEGSPAADQFFRDGRAAMKKGDWEKARAMFAESQRLDPAPGTLVNLAIAEEKVGKLASAWEHARAAEDGLPQGDDRRAVAKKLHDGLEDRLPRLTLRADKALPDGTKITVDDTELSVASLGVALPEDPGEHRVLIRSPGHKDLAVTVKLLERGKETYTVELGELSSVPVTDGVPVTPEKPHDRPTHDRDHTDPPAQASSMRTVGWVLVGVGAAGLATGGVFGALAIGRKNAVDQHCTPGCDGPGNDAKADGRTFATVSTIAFIAGGALAAGGVVLVLVSPTPPKGERAGLDLGREPGRFDLGELNMSLGLGHVSLGGTF